MVKIDNMSAISTNASNLISPENQLLEPLVINEVNTIVASKFPISFMCGESVILVVSPPRLIDNAKSSSGI